ncbi:MAG TPA: MFS transporter [Firmicutes bacterium]|nr:MFS transporter [Candidatus Fermentithermobacillaceae bacterium]
MSKSLRSLLKQRDFTLLLAGQFVSKLGSGINGIGLTLYVMKFENPILGLGTLMLLLHIPWLMFGPLAGTLADRYSKKSIIIMCDILRGIFGILLFYSNSLVGFYAIVLLITTLDVLFSPAVGSFLPFIVAKDELEEANSVYSASGEVARLIGPALGGTLVALLGTSSVFLINGISYILSGISETFICDKGISASQREKQSTLDDITEGIQYTKHHKRMGFIIIFFAFDSVALGGVPIAYLNFIRHDLMTSEALYGLFMTINGIGYLVGSLLVPRLQTTWTKLELMIKGTGVYGFFLVLFALFKFMPYNMLLFFLLGVVASLVNVSYSIFLQQEVAKDMIGRVYSLDMALSTITGMLSIILITLLGDRLSNTTLILLFAGITILISLYGQTKIEALEQETEDNS